MPKFNDALDSSAAKPQALLLTATTVCSMLEISRPTLKLMLATDNRLAQCAIYLTGSRGRASLRLHRDAFLAWLEAKREAE